MADQLWLLTRIREEEELVTLREISSSCCHRTFDWIGSSSRMTDERGRPLVMVRLPLTDR